MKKAVVTVVFEETRREGITAYQADGHIHVCRDPRDKKYWIMVHAPTGLVFNEAAAGVVPFRTRRRAAAVAKDFGAGAPELTTRTKIKTYVRNNNQLVRQELKRACWRNILL